MKKYLKLLRIKHWLKNGIIFLPIFFSINLLKGEYLIQGLLAFLVFSTTSSMVYIINDIQDIERDRNHPMKKNRPLASGEISIKNAKIIMMLLASLTGIWMFLLYQRISNIGIISIPIVYFIMNILYSKYLKEIPIIDVVIIVCGFVLRVIYGGVCVNVEVSKYLYLMIIFGSFYLGFGKRRNEMIQNGNKSRKVLSRYSKDFLDKNMYVALALAVVSYTLWCTDPTTIARIGNDYIFWTIPLLMIILQLYSLNIEGESHGDPVEVILSDKKLLGAIGIYLIVLVFIIYVL